jgi:DNA-directed RNA polymerase subunit E'/Rpb7
MFLPVRFKTNLQLSPEEFSASFDETILQKLKSTHEGICTRFGYIKPGSIEIIRRSIGMFTKQHFNGHIRFELYCKGEVCNPPQGMVVDGVVKNKNALGLLAASSINIGDDLLPVLDIIVPRKSNGIASEVDLDQVEIGDKVLIMVMGKRYQLNDTSISIIGRIVKQRTVQSRALQGISPSLEDVVVTDISRNNEGNDLGELVEEGADADPLNHNGDDEAGDDVYEDDDYSDNGAETKQVEDEDEDEELGGDDDFEEVEGGDEDFGGSDGEEY